MNQLPFWISAAATCGIFVAAAVQLQLIRSQIRLNADENRQRATVAACERFDTDPVIHQITKRIWTASAGGKHYDPDHIDTHDLIALLNYFDALAIGVEQGFYDEAVVKAHMSIIIAHAVSTFILTEPSGRFVKAEGYEALVRLHDKWRADREPTAA
ncbi:DUF4760 domain-containing protein [Rhodovibrio salinarum]|uniref:Uncharacterized protein n=1 Tax=Rhodovibrio salinarum TaxID=1087 RepID=A0A934QE13_9PROT|nr:hypothetical protein [Rhodovibrio salinarum]MBK1695677.1 hypothetical protein [Rhodovibrio salinarum]